MKRTFIAILIVLMVMVAILGKTRINSQQATQAATAAATPDPLGGATTFAKADKPTKINMMLDWTPNPNHLGIYVAQAKGYYQDANLTVELQQPGDIQLEQVVASGKAQFGISFEEETSYARANQLPIVSVAAIIQHNTSGFAALHDKKPLKSAADLAKLRYGAYGSQLEKPILDSLLKCVGSNADKIEFINIGYTDSIPLMEKDRIDFAWLYYGVEGIDAKHRGANLDWVMLRDYSQCVPDWYTPILITSEDMINKQPDVVKAFVQATARGYAYAIQHPDEAADILLKAAPDLSPEPIHQSAQWLAAEFQADAPRWGEQKTEVWQSFTDFLVKSGALKAPIEVKLAFTNDFLPGKN
jgi:ABC-type nitrate/sulfonate/bicarbonate transport system substrate-binding protein